MIKDDDLFSLKKGEITIGATQFPDRKRPTLYVMEGNKIVGYATFHSKQTAVSFMNEFAKFCGVYNVGKKDGGE